MPNLKKVYGKNAVINFLFLVKNFANKLKLFVSTILRHSTYFLKVEVPAKPLWGQDILYRANKVSIWAGRASKATTKVSRGPKIASRALEELEEPAWRTRRASNEPGRANREPVRAFR